MSFHEAWPRLAIVIEGGVISAVVTDSDRFEGCKVLVIDYDVEGADPDDVVAIFQTQWGRMADAHARVAKIERATIELQHVVEGMQVRDAANEAAEQRKTAQLQARERDRRHYRPR